MSQDRWHKIAALFAFLVPLFVYVRTLTPTVPFWDSGEFIATSYILGLPHPPGNPVYTILGRMMSLIPLGSVAWKARASSSSESRPVQVNAITWSRACTPVSVRPAP